MDLFIPTRLKSVLPPLTTEELAQLRENIKADGRVTDPILYWDDGKRNVIVDGMHRWPIIQELGITDYKAEPINVGKTYEDAELWILNHALGQRTLLSPEALRQVRGGLYNKLKKLYAQKGEDTPPEGCDILSATGQSGQSGHDAAREVAGKAKVSIRTVERDGARVMALAQCAPAVQKGIQSGAFRLSDDRIEALAALPAPQQTAIARDLRFGKPWQAALESAGAKVPTKKPQKPSYVEEEPDDDELLEQPKPKKISKGGQQKKDPRIWREIEQHLGKALNRVDALKKMFPNGPMHKTLLMQIKQAMKTLQDWKDSAK